tara:strand:+ start:43 stop:798 length:756 start_codon:yes stop_codon:yes gene_type:complete
MSKDMKLIMEGWRKLISEVSARDTPGDIDTNLADLVKRTIQSQPKPLKRTGLYQDWKEYRKFADEAGGWWWGLRWAVDLVDPTGITDWPDVEDAWDQYMGWYNLQDSDPNKDPEIGDQLFVHFVFMVVLAIPGVDLFSELSKRIGLKLTQGFFKSVLYELGSMLAIYVAVSDIPSKIGDFVGLSIPSGTEFHRRVLQAQKWAEDMRDVIRHGEKKQRLPLGGQKGSSKKYDTFDAKKSALDPEYYPAQKEK